MTVTPPDGAVSADLDRSSDPELVARCLSGDRGAFDPLVTRHRRAVYQVCYRFVGNHEDASDLAQDAFVRAYRSLSTFRGQSAFSTWIYRIAVNVCLNRVSLKTAQIADVEPEWHVDPRAESPMDRLLRGERAERIRACIRQLPRKQRAALILRVYQDLPHDEIAQILGTTVGAVKANFFHALGNLKRLLT